jgi:hypothetical protein
VITTFSLRRVRSTSGGGGCGRHGEPRSIVKRSYLALAAAAAALALQAPAGAAVTYQLSVLNNTKGFDAAFTYASPGFVADGTEVEGPSLACASHSSATCRYLFFTLNTFLQERGPPLVGDVVQWGVSLQPSGSSHAAGEGGLFVYAPGTFHTPGIYNRSGNGVSSTLTISGGAAAAVPESAIWLTLVLGFGILGMAMRGARYEARSKPIPIR